METTAPRFTRSFEFQNFCRSVQGRPLLLNLTPEQRRERRRQRYAETHRNSNPVGRPLGSKKPGREHGMKLDPRTGCWLVGVPTSSGRRRWLTTGEKTIGDAFRVVDASGIQRLAILARANCLTNDAAQIIMAGERVTCADAIRKWRSNIKLDQARNTWRNYARTMRQIVTRFGCANKPVSALTRENLYDFVNDQTVKASTREVRLAAIMSFYRHAAGLGFVVGNIATTIRINRSMLTVEQRERTPAIPFTEEEYRRIMSNVAVPQFWRLGTALAWWLGLRMVDVCRFEWASMGDDFAVLYPQKTGRKLVLPLHDPLIGGGELRAVFDEIRATMKQDGPYCFPEAKKAYDRQFYFSKYEGGYKAALALCGIEGKSFHGLRHAFKVRLFNSGKSIDEISKLMGHASIAVTEGYGRASA